MKKSSKTGGFEISQFWGKFVDKNLVETGFFSRRSEQKSPKLILVETRY